MLKKSRIGLCLLLILCGFLLFPAKGMAYDKTKEEEVIVDIEEYLDQSLQLVLENGVIIDYRYIWHDGTL